MIYGPAEDTYLTLRSMEAVGAADTCVDVGTGSCELARALVSRCRRVIAVDICPKACRSCPSEVDVICGDGASALRRADLVVSNLPYLPPEGEDVDIYDHGLTTRLLRWISAHRPRYVVLTSSSLGRLDLILEALRAMGRIVALEVLHMFFEDIVALVALLEAPSTGRPT